MGQEKAYQVSVVTPFHNVDMELFRRGYESLKAQTIGFSNVQWIVVLHNTEQSYHEAVHKLLDGHENVIVKALSNDARTPSSPRNYGMKFATAPYLGFLDGDDSYTPKCLQTAIRHMKRTASQMVVFRREFEVEREGLFPMTEKVLWDQTQKEIVVDREHWEDEKMFSGIWGMVTSRLFDRLFLEKHGITFDEEVPFTEDNLFLIEAYGKVRRVCYLPQFIGYHYFIHEDSLVQSMGERSGAELVSYAKGFRKIFDAAFRNGIYADWFMPFTLAAFSNAMVHAEDLTLADRQEIKEILEPYVHMIRYLPVNKLTTESDAKMFYELPREVILHPESFDRGVHMQSVWNGQGTLEEILKQNQGTDYGLRYRFSALRTAEGYRSRVPLSHYDTYAPLVELQTKIGESGIFAADPVVCYLLVSGSTSRLIPATQQHLLPYMDAFWKAVQGKTTCLLMESLPMRERYNDRAVLNSLYGIMLSSFLRRERDIMQGSKAKFTSPELLLCPPDAMDTLYLRLLFALRERDVEQIVAPFTWGIAEAFSFLESHWETLCHDIESGQITPALDVPASFLRQLGGLLTADKERAEELRRVFRDGFESPVAPRIWQKLQRIAAFGTGSFRICTEHMKRYTGSIPHSNWFAALPEALLGEALEGTEHYELIPGQNFYEFLPYPEKESDMPLLLSQVEEGRAYEVIVTNRAGLYRYCTDEIIRVEKCKNGKMVFSCLGRKGHVAHIGEEVLWEHEIYEAIAEVSEAFGTPLADFAYFTEEAGESCLHLLLEPVEERGEAGMATALDTALCRRSTSYAAARSKGLSPCRLDWNQPQTHLLYRDMERFREKTAPDHIQPVHFLNTPAKVKFFLRNIEPQEDGR